MTLILRAMIVALLAVLPTLVSGQAPSVLHVKVTLVDAGQKPAPVPKHALLVSDNPATAPPRRILTGQDGAVDVKLPPGLYTVESDRPVAFGGRAYQWTQMVEVAAGRDATLELTIENAELVPVGADTTTSVAAVATDPYFLLPKWQDSVVAVWSPTSYASGFVADARGLVVTSKRAVGSAASVEVQLTGSVKVAGRVLAADAARDVAVVEIDRAIMAAMPPLPLECGRAGRAAVAVDQELFTIGAPLRGEKRLASGIVSRADAQAIVADFRPGGSNGGPVFAADGRVVGVSTVDESAEARYGDSRVVRIEAACEVLASAENKIGEGKAPSAMHLPVEPSRPFPRDVLEAEAKQRAGRTNPYPMSSADYDIVFITPVLAYAGRDRDGERDARAPEPSPLREGLATDFGNWSDYVAETPPVLLVRVTPKFEEGFWTTVGRVAASTQGVSLPPIKRFRPGFARLRAFCGDAEVTPIHPFRIEQRISESTAVYEGLYVFDPGAFGPQCKTVRLVLFSEKDPERGDSRVVDPKVIDQIWQDFAPYRTPEPQPGVRGD